MKRLSKDELAWAAQLACLFEVSAEKPGNVSLRAASGDARFQDFVASAVAIGPTFREAEQRTVGETVLAAVTATRRLVHTNTNLGMILLLAPLAKAAAAGCAGDALHASVADVLRGLTVADARLAYEAIRTASPAGLGKVEHHSVNADDVNVTLREAMSVARAWDSIAREYATDFQITFGLGYPTLRRLWDEGLGLADAIVTTFLTVLAEVPDTLIARKVGQALAEQVSRRAQRVLTSGGCRSAQGRAEVQRFDDELRVAAHDLNPGTTADLVCASLFVFLTEGDMLANVPALTARW